MAASLHPTRELIMAIRSDYGITLDCPIFKREDEIICMFLFVISCSVLWLMMAIWFEPWWITKAHSLFYQEDGTHYALFGRWCPHCKIHKAYMLVLEPMRQFKRRHACARIYSCLICMCGHRNEHAFCPRRCQMAHTCGRSVESIAVIWKSEKQRAREEMKQTTEGSHSAPRLCYFKLFSSHCRRREQCAA